MNESRDRPDLPPNAGREPEGPEEAWTRTEALCFVVADNEAQWAPFADRALARGRTIEAIIRAPEESHADLLDRIRARLEGAAQDAPEPERIVLVLGGDEAESPRGRSLLEALEALAASRGFPVVVADGVAD